jgi:hypothetical protein
VSDRERVARLPNAEEALGGDPAGRVDVLVQMAGPDIVADWCAGLVMGADPLDPDQPPLEWLGGGHATAYTSGVNAYWPRVWGARGLLHAYRSQAEPAVVAGLSDEHWRVREMCAKVARAHEVGAAAAELSARCADDVARVRAAAVRALAVVGEAEDADAVRDCLDDPERSVAAAAERALSVMSQRLDRELSVED